MKASYRLLHQKWLIEDSAKRGMGVGGVGPHGYVKSRVGYAAW